MADRIDILLSPFNYKDKLVKFGSSHRIKVTQILEKIYNHYSSRLETVLKEKANSGATLKQIPERLEQLRVHEKIQNEKVEKTKEELNVKKQREAEAIAEMEVIRQEIAQVTTMH